MRKKVFFQFIFTLALIVSTFLLTEIVFRIFVFRRDSNYQRIYEAITAPGAKAPYSSQPYLNYINTPNLKNTKGIVCINSIGIRYPREIALHKPAGTYRILFLGGSTTFGDIEDSYDVFPALIEKMLRDSLALQSRYSQIECLNAGVHGLTSAELLTHYQFKYQYLEPDLIVIHTGFNDAFTYARIHGSQYQPDYHNSRRVFKDIQEPSASERVLLHSKAIAYFFIHVWLKDFLKTTLEDNIFFHETNDKIWFAPANDAIGDTAYNAFYNNIRTLVKVAEGRKVPILLVPEVCDSTKMPPNLQAYLPKGLRLHHELLRQIASRDSLYFMALPESEFPSEVFLNDDPIHVNEKGEKLKAHYIGQCIQGILHHGLTDRASNSPK